MAQEIYRFQLGQLVTAHDGYMGQIVMESGRDAWILRFPPADGWYYRVDWGGRLPPGLYESKLYHEWAQTNGRACFHPSPYVAEHGAVLYESWEAEKLLAWAVPHQVAWWNEGVMRMRARRDEEMKPWSAIANAAEMARALRRLQMAMFMAEPEKAKAPTA